jgi:hypothetical protein
MNSLRDDYQKKMEAQLSEWSAKIDVLRARLDKKGAEAHLELRRGLDELEHLRDGARGQLAKFADATGEAWTEVKKGVEERWHKLSGAFDAVLEKVEGGTNR